MDAIRLEREFDGAEIVFIKFEGDYEWTGEGNTHRKIRCKKLLSFRFAPSAQHNKKKNGAICTSHKPTALGEIDQYTIVNTNWCFCSG